MTPSVSEQEERWLVRFGYDGTGFAGWARQPRLRTVEGVVLEGIRRYGIAAPLSARLEVASRTDRGVSARANALALSSPLRAHELLRRLNAVSPDLMFTAASRIPERFVVRHARRRSYRYFDPGPLADPARVEKATRLLVGPLDARSFGRGFSAGSPHWTPVDRVSVGPEPPGHVVEVEARSFVWGMVRKIVGALREVDRGRLTLERLEEAARGRSRLTLPMAEPEGLVLWEVDYPLEWETTWAGPNRHQAAFWERARRDAWRRGELSRALPSGEPSKDLPK